MSAPERVVDDASCSARCGPAWLAALGAMALLAPLRALAAGAPPGGDAPPIVFVGDRDYRPLSFLARGAPRGLDVEVAEALGRVLGREIRIELMDWELAQEQVRTGAADVLLGMSVTEERKASYDFSAAAFEHEFALFLRSGDLRIHGPDDLSGLTVGVTQAGSPRRLLAGRRDVALVPVQSYQEGFDRLAGGRIDAFAADLWVGSYTIQEDHLAGLTVAGEPLAKQPYGMAVRKGNLALLEDVNRGLARLEQDGTLARIRDRWRPQEMVFASREKVRRAIALGAAGVLLLLLASMALWVAMLKRQLRIQRRIEAALRESEERLARDISDRKEAEAQREEALRQLEALKARLEEENLYLREEIHADQGFTGIVGESDPLRYVFNRVRQVAGTDASVLVQGETGVGKELVARAIHDASRRSGDAFVRVNCAALAPTLAESELFGHDAGAFTGALRMRKGRFELADRGTLFLDEVGELSLELQAKLLRVLQEGEFERLGSSRTQRANVRVIAATNRNLKAEVAAGRFREDLFYRLDVFPITVPPLRDRREDIPLLVQHFLRQIGERAGRTCREVPPAVMRALTRYSWPGNVRELRNVLERAVVQCADGVLRLQEPLERARHRSAPETPEAAPATLAELERRHIVATLELTRGRVSGAGGAAELLGINPNTLRSRMKKLGVEARREVALRAPSPDPS